MSSDSCTSADTSRGVTGIDVDAVVDGWVSSVGTGESATGPTLPFVLILSAATVPRRPRRLKKENKAKLFKIVSSKRVGSDRSFQEKSGGVHMKGVKGISGCTRFKHHRMRFGAIGEVRRVRSRETVSDLLSGALQRPSSRPRVDQTAAAVICHQFATQRRSDSYLQCARAPQRRRVSPSSLRILPDSSPIC